MRRAFTTCLLLILTAAGTPAAEGPPPQTALAGVLIPDDVLDRLAKVAPEQRKAFCVARRAELDRISAIEPVTRIAGFTSRMSNQDEVPGANDFDRFVSLFGAQAVAALVTNDAERKAELVRLLAKWAAAGAILKTESCVRPGGQLSNKRICGEWRTADGSDLSAMKDATFATFKAFGLARAYYAALADAAPDELAAEHRQIRNWIGQVGLRLKRPDQVYFGLNMGWYWPTITLDLIEGRRKAATDKLKRLERGLVALIKDDGSITERTVRGDRALWYHHTSIGEIVMSMELMRAAGLPVSPKLEAKLHGAVDLFVAAIHDEKVLDKWARQRFHSTYVDGKQDWDWSSWPDADTAGSWFHIYPYRYPDRPASAELRRLVRTSARSATSDLDLGLGVGCIYNAAAASDALAAAPPPRALSFTTVTLVLDWTSGTSDGFAFLVRDVKHGDRAIGRLSFDLIADYREPSKAADVLELLRLSIRTSSLTDSGTPSFAECGDVASHPGEIRLHYGAEENLNGCILAKLGPADRELWTGVYRDFPKMLDMATAAGNEQAARLRATYAAKTE